VRFTPTYDHLPEGWTVRTQEWVLKEKTPPYVGAKSQDSWDYQQGFNLTPEAVSAFSQTRLLSSLYLYGELVYKDVFDKEHAVNWCWMTIAYRYNNGEVFECRTLVEKHGQ
jgi:hypothetical protein